MEKFSFVSFGKGLPHIAFVTGIHGDEQIFPDLQDVFKKINLAKGMVSVILAHTDAAEKNVRFVESDLNRSFPGKRNGTLEERIAHKLIQTFNNVDCLIDFHSFHYDSPPFAVMTGISKKEIKLASIIGLKENVIMTGRGVSFVEQVKLGIGVELGVVNDPKRKQRALRVIRNVLSSFEMISEDRKVKLQQNYYTAEEKTRVSNSFVLSPTIKNFKYVKKGTVLGIENGKNVVVAEGFYPILLKTNGYKDVLCRNGKKVSITS